MKTINIKIIAACLVGLLLCACSKGDPNPLQMMDNDHVGKFLVKSSVYAEQKWHLPKSIHKKAYLRCMQGVESNSTCQKVYEAMVEYAKSDLDFKLLTVSELKAMKNSPQWKTLRGDYEAAVFDYLD